MTRRDVAAMRLAYECLRDNAHGPNQAWRDGAATRVLHDAVRAARNAIPGLWDAYEGLRDFMGYRLLRARLALYLRARLRAEAGDCGTKVRRVADEHQSTRAILAGRRDVAPELDTWRHGWPETGRYLVLDLRITPLWEQAAQWWATHERPHR